MIALLTFVIGIAVGKSIPVDTKLETKLESRATEPEESSRDDLKGEPVRFANSPEQSLREIKFVCNDDFLRPFWIDLLKEPLLTRYLLGSMLQSEYDCSTILIVSELDLNDDGKNEYEVGFSHGGVCSNRGNCPTAIYGIFDDERSRMRTSAGTLISAYEDFCLT